MIVAHLFVLSLFIWNPTFPIFLFCLFFRFFDEKKDENEFCFLFLRVWISLFQLKNYSMTIQKLIVVNKSDDWFEFTEIQIQGLWRNHSSNKMFFYQMIIALKWHTTILASNPTLSLKSLLIKHLAVQSNSL